MSEILMKGVRKQLQRGRDTRGVFKQIIERTWVNRGFVRLIQLWHRGVEKTLYYTMRERLRIERAKHDIRLDRYETYFSDNYPPCEYKPHKAKKKNNSSGVAYTIEEDAKADNS